jgi:hypothetical protein
VAQEEAREPRVARERAPGPRQARQEALRPRVARERVPGPRQTWPEAPGPRVAQRATPGLRELRQEAPVYKENLQEREKQGWVAEPPDQKTWTTLEREEWSKENPTRQTRRDRR